MIKHTLLAALLVLPLGWAHAQDTASSITIRDSDNEQIIIRRGESAKTIELHDSDGQVIILEPGDEEESHLEELVYLRL